VRGFIQRFVRGLELGTDRIGGHDEFRATAGIGAPQIEVSYEGVDFVQDVQTHRQVLWEEQMMCISYDLQELSQFLQAVDLVLWQDRAGDS